MVVETVAPAPFPVAPERAADDSRQTQGKYAVQLIHALGIASALPPNATTQDAIDFLMRAREKQYVVQESQYRRALQWLQCGSSGWPRR